jgi:electron transfer flavoprotein alpha subunit
MTLNVLVVVDAREGVWKEANGPVISESRRLVGRGAGGQVVAAVLGPLPPPTLKRLREAGPDRILSVEAENLVPFDAGVHSRVVQHLAQGVPSPRVILAPATAYGRELVPRVAARLGVGTATDVTEIRANDAAGLVVVRSVFGGRATEELELPEGSAVTLRPSAFAYEPAPRDTPAEKGDLPPLPGWAGTLKRGEIRRSQSDLPDLAEAPIVVSGGRGLKSAENFAVVEDLARALGAAVGASRAVVDAGWRPASYQVGQTGKTVAPQLYIACGISGAIQHLVGMSNSRCIVAINKDPSAPIFKVANYGIVGDALSIVPALTAAVRASRASA